jgi:hypothetical protein
MKRVTTSALNFDIEAKTGDHLLARRRFVVQPNFENARVAGEHWHLLVVEGGYVSGLKTSIHWTFLSSWRPQFDHHHNFYDRYLQTLRRHL